MDACLRRWAADNADRLARTFARPGIGLRTLAADRKAAQMADATVAFNALKSLEIHADLAAEIAFDDILAILNRMNDLRELLLGQILGADRGVNAGLFQNDFRIAGADAVNVAQSDVDALVRGNFYSDDAGHKVTGLID